MVRLTPRFALARMAPRPSAATLAKQAVELEVSLRHIKPRIWRRFVVPGDIRLDRLHDVIQAVMGWTDSHLHAFRQGPDEYTIPDPEDPGWGDRTVHDERKFKLGALVSAKGDTISYTYDFGDDWEHDIKVRSITPMAERLLRAFCVNGARACPPEDCGSVPGYETILAWLANPKHPDGQHLKEWLPEGYDPDSFNLDVVNALLSRVKV